MRNLTLLLLAFFLCKISLAQKTETVYLNAADSTKNKYIIIYPAKLPWKGCLFLIPGMFQKAADVLVQTTLPMHAAQQGLLTVIPTFSMGISSVGIDSASQASLLEIMDHVGKTNKLINEPFYIGGFSIGGSCAIKFAELALGNNYPIKPVAVFALDAPLDFERIYTNTLREIRLPGSGEDALAESKYMQQVFLKVFGGIPAEKLLNYYSLSPYSFNDATQQAIRPLVNLPIRLYTEPDIHWWLKDGVDYSLMNAFDFAAMTNELKRMGNKKIELIITDNKGYRQPGNIRHPHSWSIAEPKDLVKWLLNQK